MKDTIFLVVDRARVVRMNKSLPQVARGEIPVKLEITVDDGAFREPVLTRKVEICDWRDGIDIEDVQFNGQFITEEEAGIIRDRRLERMAGILRDQGWNVASPAEIDETPDS